MASKEAAAARDQQQQQQQQQEAMALQGGEQQQPPPPKQQRRRGDSSAAKTAGTANTRARAAAAAAAGAAATVGLPPPTRTELPPPPLPPPPSATEEEGGKGGPKLPQQHDDSSSASSTAAAVGQHLRGAHQQQFQQQRFGVGYCGSLSFGGAVPHPAPPAASTVLSPLCFSDRASEAAAAGAATATTAGTAGDAATTATAKNRRVPAADDSERRAAKKPRPVEAVDGTPKTIAELELKLRDEKWISNKLKENLLPFPEENTMAKIGFKYYVSQQLYRSDDVAPNNSGSVWLKGPAHIRHQLVSFGIPNVERLDVQSRTYLELFLRHRGVVDSTFHSRAKKGLTIDGIKYGFDESLTDTDSIVSLLQRTYDGAEPIELFHGEKTVVLPGRGTAANGKRPSWYSLEEFRVYLRRNPDLLKRSGASNPNHHLALGLWVASSPVPLPRYERQPKRDRTANAPPLAATAPNLSVSMKTKPAAARYPGPSTATTGAIHPFGSVSYNAKNPPRKTRLKFPSRKTCPSQFSFTIAKPATVGAGSDADDDVIAPDYVPSEQATGRFTAAKAAASSKTLSKSKWKFSSASLPSPPPAVHVATGGKWNFSSASQPSPPLAAHGAIGGLSSSSLAHGATSNASKPPSLWACHFCDSVQASDAASCAFCNAPRLAGSPGSAEQKAEKDTWQCDQCLTDNFDPQASHCECCGAPRGFYGMYEFDDEDDMIYAGGGVSGGGFGGVYAGLVAAAKAKASSAFPPNGAPFGVPIGSSLSTSTPPSYFAAPPPSLPGWFQSYMDKHAGSKKKPQTDAPPQPTVGSAFGNLPPSVAAALGSGPTFAAGAAGIPSASLSSSSSQQEDPAIKEIRAQNEQYKRELEVKKERIKMLEMKLEMKEAEKEEQDLLSKLNKFE